MASRLWRCALCAFALFFVALPTWAHGLTPARDAGHRVAAASEPGGPFVVAAPSPASPARATLNVVEARLDSSNVFEARLDSSNVVEARLDSSGDSDVSFGIMLAAPLFCLLLFLCGLHKHRAAPAVVLVLCLIVSTLLLCSAWGDDGLYYAIVGLAVLLQIVWALQRASESGGMTPSYYSSSSHFGSGSSGGSDYSGSSGSSGSSGGSDYSGGGGSSGGGGASGSY